MADEKSLQDLQALIQRSVAQMEPAHQKLVLMLQPARFQGQVWEAALLSQGVSVIWEPGYLDPTQLLDQMKQQQLNLPDCLLIETEVLGSNPYAFCRWSRAQHPEIKVVLISANQQEISLPEHHWAVYQGAQDLLPGFSPEALIPDIMASISRLLTILNWRPLQQSELETALLPLLPQKPQSEPAALEAAAASVISPRAATLLPADSLNLSRTNPRSDPPAATEPEKPAKPPRKRTYRGVTY
ncbi:hypothetical protein BST81_07725 [Leptolyngbya sp. 'hensonii']|uniref:response regulator n=1 Tax=Leptolyngbya sp. 'hensonii' TaxID=1922337 RepID=UPI00094F7EA7|nr:response regulator [Leptolyngbya sp. 'hensonii']OLP19091.1 hypothetical protein BST81_07725 [Leptolyngbya sp. 'hensonii']